MSQEPILLAIASGSDDLVPTLIDQLRAIRPELPVYVLSEFRPPTGTWIPYNPARTLSQNRELCKSALRGKRIVFAGLILQPRMPYWTMRLLGVLLGGLNTIFFNENLDHFLLRPRSIGVIARHLLWRMKNLVRWELRPGGATYTFLWRLRHPGAFRRPIHYRAALLAGRLAALRPPAPARLLDSRPRPKGISIVIPSRSGKTLLEQLLPTLVRELRNPPGLASEVIVVDNGSDDGTAEWLAREYPETIVEFSAAPLSFARAVNRGIRRARLSHVLMLNNDMVLQPGFFPPLLEAFEQVPGLFCATAQILFPPGVRREETGKAVMPAGRNPQDFPVRCEVPIESENLTYVLYGSGGCSLFEARKIEALGGLDEIYEPAYVEDLDLGFRGWQQGWPTVFVAGARLEHRHRATTSRFYEPAMLARTLEMNYLRFAARACPRVWRDAVCRLNLLAARMDPDPAATAALSQAWRAALTSRRVQSVMSEEAIFAVTSGEVAVFPGRSRGNKPVVLIASPYLPFPLSHGGAVRIYNLMRRGAADFDQVLVCFAADLAPPPPELLAITAEVVVVRLPGSHLRRLTSRPDTVEEHDHPAFHGALQLTTRKWKPSIAQLEFTQMAAYIEDCTTAKTVLVEHDITFDLFHQMLSRGEDWETRQQYERWLRFERAAWSRVDRVVIMSDKDRQATGIAHAATLANGVDLERFQASAEEPEPDRILFIGSFAHLPNVLAVNFFLRRVWPDLIRRRPGVLFHIIAGSRHQFYLERCQDKVRPPLDAPRLEVEDFVADPRPAYRRAAVVVAPLLASAGTNIKIMEAMAMGKAIVSTAAGINGLDDLRHGFDVVVAANGPEMAEAIAHLLAEPAARHALGQQARRTVEKSYGWDAVAARQKAMYEELLSSPSR